MIDSKGGLSTSFEFSGDDSVYKSCGVIHKNDYLIYGGKMKKTNFETGQLWLDFHW